MRTTYQNFNLLVEAFLKGLKKGKSGDYAHVREHNDVTYLFTEHRYFNDHCVAARFPDGSLFLPNIYLQWNSREKYLSNILHQELPALREHKIDQRYVIKDGLITTWGSHFSPIIGNEYLKEVWGIPTNNDYNRAYAPTELLPTKDLQMLLSHINPENGEVDASDCTTHFRLQRTLKIIDDEARSIIWRAKRRYQDMDIVVEVPNNVRVYDYNPDRYINIRERRLYFIWMDNRWVHATKDTPEIAVLYNESKFLAKIHA